jgi:hypothetical protein
MNNRAGNRAGRHLEWSLIGRSTERQKQTGSAMSSHRVCLSKSVDGQSLKMGSRLGASLSFLPIGPPSRLPRRLIRARRPPTFCLLTSGIRDELSRGHVRGLQGRRCGRALGR